MTRRKKVTITVEAEHRKCSRCGHQEDEDPVALYVSDDGPLGYDPEVYDGDFMDNDARIAVEERREAYEAKGYEVDEVWP